MDNRIKRTVFLAVSVALAMILSFVESLVPPLSTVPGVKIGLSNPFVPQLSLRPLPYRH